MPKNNSKRSGLYYFADQYLGPALIEGINGKKAINQDQEDQQAILLFANNQATEPNPFALKGYKICNDGYWRAHITIHKYFCSSNSEIINRRSLSYCHGTEYFQNNDEIIVAHYYFDKYRNYTHTLCKSISTNQEEQKYDPSIEELFSLEQRAAQFGSLIAALIDAKEAKFAELAGRLEKNYIQFTDLYHNKGLSKQQLAKEIETIKSLAAEKNLLSDEKSDLSFSVFCSIIDHFENERLKALQLQASSKSSKETEEGAEEQTATVVEQAAAVKPNAKRLKKLAKIKLAQDLANVKLQIVSLDNNLDIDVEYLLKLEQLKASLLEASFSSHVTPEQLKDIQSMLDKIAQHSPLELFRSAVIAGNYAKSVQLHSFCSSLVNYEIYLKLVHKWIEDAKSSPELVNSRQLIFDYLNDNCDVFNNFIYHSNSVYFAANENKRGSAYNLLACAYITGNKKIFSALLRYGFNPTTPWIEEEDCQIKGALTMIAFMPYNTSFFVDELKKYGVSYNKKCTALVKLSKLHDKAKKAKSAIQRRGASKEYQELSKFGATQDDVARNALQKSANYYTTKFSPFPLLVMHSQPENYPLLFSALIQEAALSDLLIAFGVFAFRYLNVSFVCNASEKKIKMVASPEALLDDSDNCAVKYFLPFSEGERKNAIGWCVKAVVAKLNEQIPLCVDFNSVLEQLNECCQESMAEQQSPRVAACSYASAILNLHKADLTVDEQSGVLRFAEFALQNQKRHVASLGGAKYALEAFFPITSPLFYVYLSIIDCYIREPSGALIAKEAVGPIAPAKMSKELNELLKSGPYEYYSHLCRGHLERLSLRLGDYLQAVGHLAKLRVSS